jgi:metal-responsive CopG/Arc/MetJ family transcriptional regulator
MIHTIGYTFVSKKGMKMANIKTAISIEKPLFEEVEALAEEMKVSRSYLFTLATRDFIQYHKSQKLLDAINATYDDSPDNEEKRLRVQMKSKHRQLVKGQW